MSLIRSNRRTKARQALAVLLLSAALAWKKPAIAQDKPPARQIVEMPLLPNPAGKWLVAATLNGNVPATFLFDTGAFYFIISDTLAAKLKAQPAPEYRDNVIVFNGYTGIWLTRLQELAFGPWKLANYPVCVATDKLFQINPNVAAEHDGFIGAAALRQLQVAIAVYPRAAKLELFQPGDLPASVREAAGFGPGAFEVPLAWDEKEQNYKVQVTVAEGEKTWTGPLLDTGSNVTAISAEAAQQLGLTPHGQGQAFGLGEITSIAAAPVDRLSFGSLSVTHVEQVDYPVTGGKLRQLLGLDVLGRYNLLIDFVAGKLYLAPLEEAHTEHR